MDYHNGMPIDYNPFGGINTSSSEMPTQDPSTMPMPARVSYMTATHTGLPSSDPFDTPQNGPVRMGAWPQPSPSYAHHSNGFAWSPPSLPQPQATFITAQAPVQAPYHPAYSYDSSRRGSTASQHSQSSSTTSRAGTPRDGVCHCGNYYKDLAGHQRSHLDERPHKCCVSTCHWYKKGFARKYDMERHTLLHFKGIIWCNFCPGPVKFNCTKYHDFRQHLVSGHGLDLEKKSRSSSSSRDGSAQSPPSSDTGADCSLCLQFYPSPLEYDEHFSECMTNRIMQVDASEEINERNLSSVPPVEMSSESSSSPQHTTRRARRGQPGLTYSRGGVQKRTAPTTRRRKTDQDLPPDWNQMPLGTPTMRKRVAIAYDGQHRLNKDEMMLYEGQEAMMPLSPAPDNVALVSNLDVATIDRLVGFHYATAEERGTYQQDNIPPSFEQQGNVSPSTEQQHLNSGESEPDFLVFGPSEHEHPVNTSTEQPDNVLTPNKLPESAVAWVNSEEYEPLFCGQERFF